MIEIPKRPGGGMSINLPGGARMLSRQARPLNGIEIKQALIVMCNQLALELADREVVGWDLEEKTSAIDYFVENVQGRLNLEWALNKSHVCYPGVGWSIQVGLEKHTGQGEGYMYWGKIELDFAMNVRSEYLVGPKDYGQLVGTVEHEQLNTNIPDRMRQNSGLPVEVDYIRQDGTTGKAQVKMARSVEIGGGKSPVREPEEVKVVQVIESQVDLPELPAEELLAEPSEAKSVQPSKPMVYSAKPKAEIKRGK